MPIVVATLDASFGRLQGMSGQDVNHGHSHLLAFSSKDFGGDALENLSPTLRSMGHSGSHANAGGQVAIAFDARQSDVCVYGDATGPLDTQQPGPAVAFDLRGRDGGSQFEGPHDTANIRAASGGSSRSYVATSAVRRLTPRECERLQGFPDDHTRIPNTSTGGWRDLDEDEDLEELRALGLAVRQRGNTWRVKDPDGPRYKALGNSMAVPVMRWIGERLQQCWFGVA